MLTAVQIGYVIMLFMFILVYFMYAHVENEMNELSYTLKIYKDDYFREQNKWEQDIYLLGELVIEYEEKSYWLQKKVDWLDDQLGIAEDEYSALEFENIGLQNEITQLENENAELNDELLNEEE